VASGRCSRLDGVYDFEAKGCFSRFGRVEVLKPMSFLWAGQVAEGRPGQGKAGQGRSTRSMTSWPLERRSRLDGVYDLRLHVSKPLLFCRQGRWL
jgi:hypothetical protein